MSIEGRRLLYCPVETQENHPAFITCKGYLELDSDTEVKVKYLTQPAYERLGHCFVSDRSGSNEPVSHIVLTEIATSFLPQTECISLS